MTADQRQHRSPKPRARTVHRPVPDRCKPTLFVRFVDQQPVEVEHRHVERRPIPMPETFRANQPTAPFDPGCSGPCVGRRDVLPLSYLYDRGADHEVQVGRSAERAVGA